MKVYVKKEDCQSMLPGIIITIVFLSFSITYFAFAFAYNNFMKVLEKSGIILVFSLFFFGMGTYFAIGLFKKTKRYSAKLISKEKTKYNGKTIYYMKFQCIKKNSFDDETIDGDYQCFTYNDNDLCVNQIYDIYVKEFNWQIKKVDTNISTNIVETPKFSLTPLYIIFILLDFALTLLGVLGIIFYPEYTAVYIIWILFFTLGPIFCLYIIKK